jgi:hypothetical protein
MKNINIIKNTIKSKEKRFSFGFLPKENVFSLYLI